jgi:pyruvate dehydrogenase E2 component (dihydrolipoamide acetyltransferase)
MEVRVTMPALGESVTEGTVTRWLKNVGDQVSADEPLLEVSTDKVDTEIPAPASGVLLAIHAAEDAVVPVGGDLAVIGDSADAAPSGGNDAPAPQQSEPAPAPQPEAPAPQATEPTSDAPQQSGPSQGSSGGSGEGTPVLLPALGESVTEGTVTRWLKNVGDTVAADEPLLEVSTDKVDTEVPSPVAGVLTEIRVNADEVVPVGATLAIIGGSGASSSTPEPKQSAPAQSAPSPTAAQQSAPAPTPVAAPAPAAPAPSASNGGAGASNESGSDSSGGSGGGSGGDAYVTPLVRKLAAEHDIDLSTLTGTGVGGRIRKQDVLDAAAKRKEAAKAAPAQQPAAAASSTPTAPKTVPSASPLRGRTEPMSRLRKVIAERMVESLQTSAQLTTVVEVDVTRIAALRIRQKDAFLAREGVKLSFLPFFAKAAVEALKAYPQVNASIDQQAGTITYHEAEHLGVAVDTDRGLLVPVIREAGDLNIAGLARKIDDVASRTRESKVTPDELSGGTFTLTNTGSRGALFDTPIINQPQVAILGTGAVVKRPVVTVDETGADSIAIRHMVFLALTYDHRVVDGADAARFLSTVKARLEEGAFEAELQ